MRDLTAYLEVRSRMAAGDLIVFWGGGILSGLIRLFSGGPSHCAVVRQSWHQNHLGVDIFESTILDGKDGCQTNNLSVRLSGYDGSAAWLPLKAEARRCLNLEKFYAAIGEIEDSVRYDKIGLAEFLLRDIPIAGNYIAQKEHPKQMMCSAVVAALWERSGLLRGINEAKTTPQDLCEMRLYREFVPILGKPPRIRNFNSV